MLTLQEISDLGDAWLGSRKSRQICRYRKHCRQHQSLLILSQTQPCSPVASYLRTPLCECASQSQGVFHLFTKLWLNRVLVYGSLMHASDLDGTSPDLYSCTLLPATSTRLATYPEGASKPTFIVSRAPLHACLQRPLCTCLLPAHCSLPCMYLMSDHILRVAPNRCCAPFTDTHGFTLC